MELLMQFPASNEWNILTFKPLITTIVIFNLFNLAIKKKNDKNQDLQMFALKLNRYK